jgi:hypothetical protein
MIRMASGTLPKHWAPSGRPWQTDLEKGRFQSPSPRERPDEFYISERLVNDGWISGRISFPEESDRDAGFVFRYHSEQEGFLAGVGGWDSRFFVAEMRQGKEWKLLKKVGTSKDLQGRRSFILRVRFDGPNIHLYENNVEQLHAVYKRYRTGRIGLYASSPKVSFSDVQVSQKRCFVVMPFAPRFDKVYEDIKAATEAKDLLCVRSDENRLARPIMTEVVDEIKRADLVIVDLTDQNPNVYYEAGLAHAFGKECIILAESVSDVTFDLRQIRTKFYGRNRENLQKELEHWIDAALAPR